MRYFLFLFIFLLSDNSNILSAKHSECKYKRTVHINIHYPSSVQNNILYLLALCLPPEPIYIENISTSLMSHYFAIHLPIEKQIDFGFIPVKFYFFLVAREHFISTEHIHIEIYLFYT